MTSGRPRYMLPPPSSPGKYPPLNTSYFVFPKISKTLLLFLCFFPLFVVSNIQVDEETLSGKYLEGMSKRGQYPLAHIYEYSKCKSSLSSPLLKLPAIWSSFLLFISSLHLINSCTLSYSLLTIILIWASSTALVDGSISSNICHVCVSKVTFSVGSVRCLCCFIMFPLKKFHNM